MSECAHSEKASCPIRFLGQCKPLSAAENRKLEGKQNESRRDGGRGETRKGREDRWMGKQPQYAFKPGISMADVNK
uniref:Uncharacterized protein n=1 Tax=Paramormyrops kingsleyae TaxID=1676925 RepID=A0A3B3RJX2_9TELE